MVTGFVMTSEWNPRSALTASATLYADIVRLQDLIPSVSSLVVFLSCHAQVLVVSSCSGLTPVRPDLCRIFC